MCMSEVIAIFSVYGFLNLWVLDKLWMVFCLCGKLCRLDMFGTWVLLMPKYVAFSASLVGVCWFVARQSLCFCELLCKSLIFYCVTN